MDTSSVFREWSCTRYVGSGSFGTVLEIRKKKGGEVSALKMIPIPLSENELREKQQELGDDPELLKLEFQDQIKKVREKEIGVLEQCRGQRNIVQVYESDVVPNPSNPICSYILIRMELLYKIEDYLRGKTQRDVLKMFRDIAQALDFLESRRMLHRDIKRANIMISQSGDYKLTDFGEARDILTKNAASTKAGTPYFMAPEVWSGQRYDSRADIYSLAMTVYNCLYQFRYPFQQLGARSSVSAYEANQRRLEGRSIPPIPNVDDRLNAILLRCLEYDPIDRYPSARSLLEDINQLLQTRNFKNEKLIYPGKASDEGSSMATFKPRRSGGRVWAIVGGSVALVGVIVAVVLLASGKGNPTPATPLPTLAVATPQAVRIDQVTVGNQPAGGEPLEIPEGTISINWSATGEVDHYLLTVRDEAGKDAIDPREIPAGATSTYISVDDAKRLEQDKVYTLELSAVPAAGGEAQAAVASASFYVHSSETSGEAGSYTVSYSYEGAPPGAPVLPMDASYAAGSEVTVAPEPSYTGYHFGGWNVDGADVQNGKFTMPSYNVSVIGVWTVEEFNVTYVYSEPVPEDAPEPPAAELHAYNTLVELASAPTMDGYTFGGWQVNGANVGSSFTMQPADVVITGSWTINTHNVTFAFSSDAPSGAQLPANTSYAFGETVTLPVMPEVEGYVFSWVMNGTPLEDNTFEMPDTDVSLVGTWLPGEYRVTYSYAGDIPEGAPAAPQMEVYDYGEPVKLAALPTLKGYAVAKWESDDVAIVDGQFTMPGHDVAIKGTWVANPHNLTYIYTGTVPANAPTAPAAETHGFQETVTAADYPTMVGYTFSGWTADLPDVVLDDNRFTMPDRDVRLSGSWIINEHTVSYQYDGFVPEGVSDAPAEETWSYGVAAKPAAVTGVTGYTFSGWTASNATVGSDGSYTVPDEDVVFHGSWTPNEHRVTFAYTGDVPEGANQTLPQALTCAFGETVELEMPAMRGYAFSGWTAQGVDIENNRFTMPDMDVTLTGSWEIGVAYAYFRYEEPVPEGAPELPEDAKYKYGEWVELPAPTLVGYTFSGWTADADDLALEATGFMMPEDSVTLTGSWIANRYTVRFEYDDTAPEGAPVLTSAAEHGYGETIDAPAPELEGYTFQGWSAPGVEVVDGQFTVPDGDVTLVGSWAINRHWLRFEYDGSAPANAPALPADEEYDYGHPVMLLSPQMEGYTFTGWKVDGEDAGIGFSMPDGDVTLVGGWEVNSHAAHFEYDETAPQGAPDPAFGDIYEYGAVVSLPLPEAEGFDFTGWTLDGAPVEDGFTMPDGEVTFVGGWQRRSHTVGFRYEGEVPEGAPLPPESAVYEYGASVALPQMQMEGYRFSGWSLDGVALADGFAMPDEDLELSGSWEEIRYTVAFDTAGGEPVPEAQSVSANGQAAAPETVPSLPGQKFAGWLLNGERYDFAAPVTGDITLVAQWVLDLSAVVPGNLRFSVMDGAGNVSPQDVFVTLADGSDLNDEQRMRVTIRREYNGEVTLFAGEGIKWSRHGIEFGDNAWVEGATYTLVFQYDGVEFDRYEVVYSLYSGESAPDYSEEVEGLGNGQLWNMTLPAPEHLWMRVTSTIDVAPAVTLYGLEGGSGVTIDGMTPVRADIVLEDGTTQIAWMWDIASKWGQLQGEYSGESVGIKMLATFTEEIFDSDQPYEVFWDWTTFDEEAMRAQLRAQGYVFPDEVVEEEATEETPEG